MKITNSVRSLVAQSLREQEMNQAELAKKIGVDRSWGTRFFKSEGGMKTLSDDLRWKIEEVLSIKFFKTVNDGEKSGLSQQIEEAIEKDPRLGTACELLLSSLNDDHYYDLPYVPTKDLVDFGKEIVRASHEDPDKPGKVGKIAIKWISERLPKLNPAKDTPPHTYSSPGLERLINAKYDTEPDVSEDKTA